MIKFYSSKVDKGSHMPGWTQTRQIEKLSESIDYRERMLERDEIPDSEKGRVKAEIKRDKKRLEDIRESRPNPKGAEKDQLSKAHKEIGEKIADTMFSRDEMMKGLADPHEEFRRQKQPCIKVDPELAKACNIKPDEKGRVSRDQASKIYQLTGKALGENTNTEALRRDSNRRE